MKKELQKALDARNLYDYVANYGEQLSKAELINLLKELDFAIYSCCTLGRIQEIYNQLEYSLKEQESECDVNE